MMLVFVVPHFLLLRVVNSKVEPFPILLSHSLNRLSVSCVLDTIMICLGFLVFLSEVLQRVDTRYGISFGLERWMGGWMDGWLLERGGRYTTMMTQWLVG